MNNSTKILLALAAGWLTATVSAQDRIHYTGTEISNPTYHDGQLSPVVGVHNIQLVRAKTYKVKKGDTLLNIAKKQLGSSSRRKEIYKLNKSRIEQAAKKHGRKSSSNGLYLYKGTVLKLPK